MQKPIRYYITKSGEESTVRSVKVAQDSDELDERSDSSVTVPAEPSTLARQPLVPTGGVRRLVNGAIRRRPPEA